MFKGFNDESMIRSTKTREVKKIKKIKKEIIAQHSLSRVNKWISKFRPLSAQRIREA